MDDEDREHVRYRLATGHQRLQSLSLRPRCAVPSSLLHSEPPARLLPRRQRLAATGWSSQHGRRKKKVFFNSHVLAVVLFVHSVMVIYC